LFNHRHVKTCRYNRYHVQVTAGVNHVISWKVSIWVMKVSLVLLFGVLKNCSMAAEHAGNSPGWNL
jgi:hypothetical protein